MTDLITGLIFATVLVLLGYLVYRHDKTTRQAMLEEMERLEKLEEERLKAEAKAKAKAKAESKEAKPAPKKRRGRPKKSNGKKEMD